MKELTVKKMVMLESSTQTFPELPWGEVVVQGVGAGWAVGGDGQSGGQVGDVVFSVVLHVNYTTDPSANWGTASHRAGGWETTQKTTFPLLEAVREGYKVLVLQTLPASVKLGSWN